MYSKFQKAITWKKCEETKHKPKNIYGKTSTNEMTTGMETSDVCHSQTECAGDKRICEHQSTQNQGRR